MVQFFIVIGLFLLAAVWMGRRLFGSVWGKQDGTCEKCAMGKRNKANDKANITTSSDR